MPHVVPGAAVNGLTAPQTRLLSRFAVVFARSEGRDWIALQPNEVATARALEARCLVKVTEVPVLNLMGTRATITAAGRAVLTGASAKPLTASQRAMLARLQASPRGYELVPGGNRAAALSASAWWRTARCLIARGLARRCEDTIELTAAGRAAT